MDLGNALGWTSNMFKRLCKCLHMSHIYAPTAAAVAACATGEADLLNVPLIIEGASQRAS
eukprot:5429315-Karenia_brevis.AAC.1